MVGDTYICSVTRYTGRITARRDAPVIWTARRRDRLVEDWSDGKEVDRHCCDAYVYVKTFAATARQVVIPWSMTALVPRIWGRKFCFLASVARPLEPQQWYQSSWLCFVIDSDFCICVMCRCRCVLIMVCDLAGLVVFDLLPPVGIPPSELSDTVNPTEAKIKINWIDRIKPRSITGRMWCVEATYWICYRPVNLQEKLHPTSSLFTRENILLPIYVSEKERSLK